MAKDYKNYSESTWGPTKRTTQGKIFSRADAWPSDYSQLFLSLEDAQKYAANNEEDPDEREISYQSYAGQIIGVKVGVTGPTGSEVGIYDGYIIQGDGTLKKLGSDGGEIECLTPAEVDEIFDETP